MNIKYIIKAVLTKISPELNTRIYYWKLFKKRLNLKNPQLFNEKTCWLKLYRYNYDPLVKKLADKYLVREYIKKLGFENILIELLEVYGKPEEIEWDKLPQKFVLKLNVGSSANLICADKSKLDINFAKEKVKSWFSKTNLESYYLKYGEMQYKDVKPKIIIEKFIEDKENGQLIDYKFFCVNGRAEYVLVCLNRFSQKRPSFYLYDRDWNFCSSCINPQLNRPVGLTQAFEYADKLSKDFPFVRVDLYIVNGKIYFGELTFTGNGGCTLNITENIDIELGKKLKLN